MNSVETISQTVEKVRRNDGQAMNRLYGTFVKEMLTASYRITNNLSDSEDVIQESFIHSFRSISQLKENQRYAGWLKRIVINKSLKLIKKTRSIQPLEVEMTDEIEEDGKWYEQIPFENVQKAIQELPDGCRQVLTLHLLDGYKHKEIAAFLEFSLSTSKSQYQYALRLLRIALKTYKHE